MSVSARIQGLVDQGKTVEGVGDQAYDTDELELLCVAIQAASDLQEQHVDVLGIPEGVTASTTSSLWDDIFASVTLEKGVGSSSHPMRESQHQTTQHLVALLTSLAGDDSQVYESLLSTVTSALSRPNSSDEDVSITLAETLGFEQLDLVEAIVKSRNDVLSNLQILQRSHQHRVQKAREVVPPVNHADTPSIQGHSISETPLSSSSKPYTPGSSVVVHTREQIEENKRRRAEQRRQQRARGHNHDDTEDQDHAMSLTAEEMAIMRAQSLEQAASRPLTSSDRITSSQPQYPHVFVSGAGGNVLSAFGTRFSLPSGTSRQDHEFYEEVTIPPPRQLPMRSTERLIPIEEMEPLARGAFPGYKTLNRLQSVVFPLGYNSNENLLVCAPTGAGKTDVAMLTVLRAIRTYAENLEPLLGSVSNGSNGPVNAFGIRYNDFKIIYVAPMKALASEIVGKFSKRLRYLGVKVRELTGDMQMTRKEIEETQMIVTTPEKWDVVTRKPTGEGELAAKVKLLIIDEVHLLHEQRGAVIETIVARTLRLVESSQSLIRIVGLSATLPNYVDVADFLRVNRYQGLFFFDSSFRPVPLEQHFIGVKGKANSPVARQRMDKATFEKLHELLEQGHQVMIFVHARKETVKTSYTMRDMCRDEGILEAVTQARDQANPDAFRREIVESRNRELKELYDTGFGIHHAGMLRKDRNLSERLFEAGVTRVLCCTATLAWGVNLPAYAVLIKGTDIYDASLGRFSDLSILDVLQIFGRAGRPQYEKVGVGYIITSLEKLSHYVDAITSQHPIESSFKTGIIDALNAECALGSVNNIADGVTWLSYTYLFTRMRRNPLAYGMLADEVLDDPQLGSKRLHEITAAAKYLTKCKMLELAEGTGQMRITELGRIAARYYITYRTVEIFNEKLRNHMSEADLLSVFGQATDFEQIQPRENEIQELKKLEERVPCEISGACDTPSGKSNLLLQAFISKLYIDDFALVSDSGYVSQNAGRIMRAVFETSLSKCWASTAAAALGLTKSIERRLWPFDHPLAQSGLRSDMIHQLSQWADEVEIRDLAAMSKEELAKLCKINDRHADAIRQAAKRFPLLRVQHRLRPLSYDILQIDVTLARDYDWEAKEHNGGTTESFYVWIEDEEGSTILQSKRLVFHARSAPSQTLLFNVEQTNIIGRTGVSVRWISERWLGSEDLVFVPFDDLRMANPPTLPTKLKDLTPLTTADCLQPLQHAGEAISSSVTTLNALQTQVFHAFLHTEKDTLLGMTHRAGRTLLVHIAIIKTLQAAEDGAAAIVLHPTMQQARHACRHFKQYALGIDARSSQDEKEISAWLTTSGGVRVLFSTPTSMIESFRAEPKGSHFDLRIIVIEDAHLMTAASELALATITALQASRNAVRLIATSVSLENVSALQAWLGIDEENTFNFSAAERPSALRTEIIPFDLGHSLHLLNAMTKPAYDRIKQSIGQSGRAVVFVPSRNQSFEVARNLVRQAASELDVSAFLGTRSSASDLQPYLPSLREARLGEPLLAGVGVLSESTAASDRRLILALYDSQAIRVLVISRDACRSLSEVHGQCVVIMGTQFVRIDENYMQLEEIFKQSGNQLRSGHARVMDYTMADVVRMQSFAAAPQPEAEDESKVGPNECFVLCQGDQASHLRRLLGGAGMLVESELLSEEVRPRSELLVDVLRDMHANTVRSSQSLLDKLRSTFLYHRIRSNPSYYQSGSGDDADVRVRLEQASIDLLAQLTRLRCITQDVDTSFFSLTQLGASIVKQKRLSVVVMMRLQAMQAQYAVEPDKFAKRMVSLPALHSHTELSKSTSKEVLNSLLIATRRCIPGETLARFDVPRLSRKTEGKEETGGTSDEELTAVQQKALLLAIFFSEPQYDIRTPIEAAQITAKRTAKLSVKSDEGQTPREDTKQISLRDLNVAKRSLQGAMFSLLERIIIAGLHD
jgi:antiviral helicase SLH1